MWFFKNAKQNIQPDPMTTLTLKTLAPFSQIRNLRLCPSSKSFCSRSHRCWLVARLRSFSSPSLLCRSYRCCYAPAHRSRRHRCFVVQLKLMLQVYDDVAICSQLINLMLSSLKSSHRRCTNLFSLFHMFFFLLLQISPSARR